MDTVVDVTETTQIIQAEAPTEIHMRVTVRIPFEDHVNVQVYKVRLWVACVLGGSGTLFFSPTEKVQLLVII